MKTTTFNSSPKTLYDFYMESRKQQMEAHGEEYCKHHDAILHYGRILNCTSYKEFGVFQGTTGAVACLSENFQKIELIDKNIKPFQPFEHLLTEYCNKKNKVLNVQETSSLSTSTVSPVDLLLIDSYHKASHLKQELELHSDTVNKCIIFHDTSHKPELFDEIQRFLKNNSKWELGKHYKENVGYTVIVRK